MHAFPLLARFSFLNNDIVLIVIVNIALYATMLPSLIRMDGDF